MANVTYKTNPKNGQHFNTSTTAAKNVTALSADSATVHCSVDTYFKAGSSSVVATAADYDMHLTAGAYIEISLNGATHISAILASGTGVFYVNSEK